MAEEEARWQIAERTRQHLVRQTAMTEAEWRADVEAKLRTATLAHDRETDPKKKRSLRGTRDNFKRQLTMGRQHLAAATVKANANRR